MGAGGPGPLLHVPPRRRETFAYACEVWACLDRIAPSGRRAGLADFRETATPPDARVDRRALDRVLAAALEGGGWGALGGWGGAGR